MSQQILLDTHVLLWWLFDDKTLKRRARAIISDHTNTVFVSSVTSAEISIKASLGKLDAPAGLSEAITQSGFQFLDFEHSHAETLRHLPWEHRDPFDRMLIAQALDEDLYLMTADSGIPDYFAHTGLKLIPV